MQPKISIVASGNLYMRQMRFNKGDVEDFHCHTYDHLTLLTNGSLRVSVDDVQTVFVAPTAIKILAHKEHELEALEDNTMAYCIHALRDAVAEDVLPPQAHITDREVKVFDRVDGGLLIRPMPNVVEVDGQEVAVAPIAFLANEKINGGNFNRSQDENPLKAVLPTGEVVDRAFV